MTRDAFNKLNLADGFAIGTFQTFKKDLGKKSKKPYGRIGVLIGKTVHEFFDNVPAGIDTIDAYKGPSCPVGTAMVISKPDWTVDFSGGRPRLQPSCEWIQPITDK